MTNQIPSWARVGAKVICVQKFVSRNAMECEIPIKGIVYSIRKIKQTSNGVGIQLNELTNSAFGYVEGYNEVSFSIKGFRPIQTKTIEQDVAIFAPLLETKSEKELVDG